MDGGERENARARCAVKVCWMRDRKLATFADRPGCKTVGAFQRKRGYRYGMYRASLEFTPEHGYASFLESEDRWTGPNGRI